MNNPTRRRFLKTGAAAIAAPMILPSRLFGKDAPSNKITVGVIGTDNKAMGGIRNFMSCKAAQVTALCDVNRNHLNEAGELAHVSAERRYRDFRELLARDDIDAVLIASPDHWHVLQAKAAIKAGKDVYCEKPLSNTIAEGRALVDTIHKSDRIFQHGTQLRSSIANHKVCSMVRNQVIGDVRQVTIGSPPGQATGDHPLEPVPDWLDWDLFQGPAPEKPYTPWRHIRSKSLQNQAAWYYISDYSKAGWVAGFGVHDMDLALWGLGITEENGPVTIEGKGVYPSSGLFDTVLTYELHFSWQDGRRITMTDTGRNPHGVKFHGDKDWLFCRQSIKSSNRDLLRTPIEELPVKLYQSRQHEANFIECCQSRKETIAPISVAHRATSLCLAGGICLKLERKLVWDPKTERFNDDEANKHLSYEMRGPWKI